MSSSDPVTCICPGSYDPVTNGHLDIIRRAAGIFERVVVGVVRDPQHKSTMFSVDERVAFLREALADTPNVQVEVFSDLVVEFARRFGARAPWSRASGPSRTSSGSSRCTTSTGIWPPRSRRCT